MLDIFTMPLLAASRGSFTIANKKEQPMMCHQQNVACFLRSLLKYMSFPPLLATYLCATNIWYLAFV